MRNPIDMRVKRHRQKASQAVSHVAAVFACVFNAAADQHLINAEMSARISDSSSKNISQRERDLPQA